jgi:hypothetical protein
MARDPGRDRRVGAHRALHFDPLRRRELAVRVRDQYIIGKFHDPVLGLTDTARVASRFGGRGGKPVR